MADLYALYALYQTQPENGAAFKVSVPLAFVKNKLHAADCRI